MNPTDVDWQAWYDRHGPALLLYARQVTRSPAEAEDALHDGFVRFWRRRDAVDDPAAYLYSAVRSAALDHRRGAGRRTRRESLLAHGDQSTASEPWHDVARDESERHLRDAIAKLPEEQREVLVMKTWGRLTFDQIAVATETPRSTAAARYAQALKSLRHFMQTREIPS